MTLIQLAHPETWGMEYIKWYEGKFTALGLLHLWLRGGCCSPFPRCILLSLPSLVWSRSCPAGFSCCQRQRGPPWLALGECPPHPARPRGLGPALFLPNTYFTCLKGGPGPPALDHLACLSEMQISGSCPRPTGSGSLGTVARKCRVNTCAVCAH